VTAGLLALIALALLQAVPLGTSDPSREALAPPAEIAAAEGRLLGTDPASFDPPGSLSVDPPASASAARTASAYAALALVAFTVASLRGPGGIALGLLAGGVFQALYGIVVLASGHDRIWTVPKTAYLQSATGTFVNRNHYAAYLAIALAAGTGLLLARIAETPRRRPGAPAWVRYTEGRGGPVVLAALAVALTAAGLLVSFSRAGTALGIAAFALTILAAGVPRRRRSRVAFLAAALAVAAVPLLSVGAAPLAERFSRSEEDFLAPGGRATAWRDTVRLAAASPLVGSGLGAFAEAYPSFRSPEVRAHYTHAHNDWLQAAAEGGLLGAACLLAVLLPVLARSPRAATGRNGPVVAGFAFGLAAFAAHAAIDFPARIPAVAAAAIAAGAVVLAGRDRRVDPAPAGPRVVPPEGRGSSRAFPAAPVLAGSLAFAAFAATLLDAGAARAAASPWERSAGAARAALRNGPADPLVRETLLDLRARIGRRPFDADARVAYAAVLLEAAFGTPDLAAAAFHARAAVGVSPVSRPVVTTAADVLLRTGEPEAALDLVRAMFGWDPHEAARLLARAEPLVSPAPLERALPDDPEAWEAWALRLARDGRREAARARREAAYARWPDDPAVRAAAADEALRRGVVAAFRAIIPTTLAVPAGPLGVALLAHRARAKGLAGDREGARTDAWAAAREGDEEAGPLLRAGDALEAVGEITVARDLFTRAAHAARSERGSSLRIAALLRVARLDEREGRAGDALRVSRDVLALDPRNREAADRVDRLLTARPLPP
jgi:O-antigen ligase/tetratricopeptide (TPR) repeat protein